MDADEIERTLGIAPGTTLVALTNVAGKLRPRSPSTAFEALSFYMPWLKTKAERQSELLITEQMLGGMSEAHRRSLLGQYLGTPANVLPFAHTGLNTDHFGFLIDGDKPTEERAIVKVVPGEPDEGTQVVAPNLREFLGLLTVAFGEVVSRQAPDDIWFVARKEYFGDDPKRMAEMEALSNVLCERIPGLSRPEHPSRVAAAHPDVKFRLSVPYTDSSRAALGCSEIQRARVAAVSAARLFPQQEFKRTVELARVGMSHPASRGRSLYIFARALGRLGKQEEAWEPLETLARAWLDESSVVSPGVHPRRVVDKGELIALLRESGHPAGVGMIEEIEKAGELPDADGDFL